MDMLAGVTTTPESSATGVDWRIDLLPDVFTLLDALHAEVGRVCGGEADPLNAYLLAVALGQIADDVLEPSTPIDRVAEFLGFGGRPATRRATVLLRAARRVFGRSGGRQRSVDLRRWRSDLGSLIELLAASLRTEGSVPADRLDHALGPLYETGAVLADAVLRGATPVLPSCFETFDLGVGDMFQLGERLTERVLLPPETTASIVMVGVRTSGSYIGPLLAEVLRSRGADVDLVTMRPGVALTTTIARFVRARASGSRFVVTDDPPVTGSSFVRCVDELVRLGVPRTSISVAYPCFIGTPERLRGLEDLSHVTLPWADWDVHARLHEAAVRSTLVELLPRGAVVRDVEEVKRRTPRRAEAHVRVVYRVCVDDPDGSAGERMIAVQGVGIGYYGEHVAVVARTQDAAVPEILGLRNGLLYREWLPESHRVDWTSPHGRHALLDGLPTYVANRRERLPARADTSLTLAGDQPVWETAAAEISSAFGRAWPIAQVLAANPLARRILHVSTPSIIDGTMELENWFGGSDRALRTVGFQDRAYWHHGLSSYDAVFDLAGATDRNLDVPHQDDLLRRYAELTGDVVTPERWLLLRLVQLWGACRRDPSSASAARQAGARVMQHYFATVFLDGPFSHPSVTTPGIARQLVALDIDGVFESDLLGFSAPTMSSAFALRSLLCHGFVPVFATGRGLEEVRDRCRSYGLIGAVAEYGSALYLSEGDECVDLRSDGERACMDALRARLSATPGVELDEAYRFGIRARVEQGPVPAQLMKDCASLLVGIRAIDGDGQTDFVSARIDKGTGLDALRARLADDSGSEPELLFAVGDTESDRPMLQRARDGAVPAHATTGPGPWRRTAAPYQAGLGEAIDAFVGHGHRRPGARRRCDNLGCELCRLAPFSREREALVALVSASESGRYRLLPALLLAARLGRTGRPNRRG